jgi:hypothetical protein
MFRASSDGGADGRAALLERAAREREERAHARDAARLALLLQAAARGR